MDKTVGLVSGVAGSTVQHVHTVIAASYDIVSPAPVQICGIELLNLTLSDGGKVNCNFLSILTSNMISSRFHCGEKCGESTLGSRLPFFKEGRSKMKHHKLQEQGREVE